MFCGLRFSIGLAAVALATGCDSTVGLDSTRSTLSKLYVPGACAVDDRPDLSEVDVSILLLGDNNAGILPTDKIQRETKPVGELLGPNDFTWDKVADRTNFNGDEPAVVEGDSLDMPRGATLQSKSLQYRYNGGDERRNQARLVVYLLDSSGSLLGRDPRTDEVDTNKGSDANDQRLQFFRTLTSALPSSTFVSMVTFNGELPNIDAGENSDGPAVPTKNRDVINTALADIARAERGGTPLARALRDTKSSIIDGNTDLNPVVVLFTDGVEDGDTSDDEDRSRLKAAIDSYAADGIPVIVLQLQPPVSSGLPRGRDPMLVELACKTGGEHLLLEQASEFTESRSPLGDIVRNRLVGSWVLRTATTLDGPAFGPGEYFLSTQLTVQLGGEAQPARLARNRDERLDYLDTRLWLSK